MTIHEKALAEAEQRGYEHGYRVALELAVVISDTYRPDTDHHVQTIAIPRLMRLIDLHKESPVPESDYDKGYAEALRQAREAVDCDRLRACEARVTERHNAEHEDDRLAAFQNGYDAATVKERQRSVLLIADAYGKGFTDALDVARDAVAALLAEFPNPEYQIANAAVHTALAAIDALQTSLSGSTAVRTSEPEPPTSVYGERLRSEGYHAALDAALDQITARMATEPDIPRRTGMGYAVEEIDRLREVKS